MAPYAAEFIRQAARHRIPDWPIDTQQPVQCHPIDPATGALTGAELGRERKDLAGDRRRAFWHLSLGLAKRADELHADLYARQPQFVTFADPQKGQPIFAQPLLAGLQATPASRLTHTESSESSLHKSSQGKGAERADGIAWMRQQYEYAVYRQVDFAAGMNRAAARCGDLQGPRAVELRVDSPHGPLLGTLRFDQAGIRETNIAPVSGRHDLYALFTAEGKIGASMMWLDWLELRGPGGPRRIEAESFAGKGRAGHPSDAAVTPVLRAIRFGQHGAKRDDVVRLPIHNTGAKPICLSVAAGSPWLLAALDEPSVAQPGGPPVSLAVRVKASELPPGRHEAEIIVQGGSSAARIGVRLEVAP